MPSLVAQAIKIGSRLTIRHTPKNADHLVKRFRKALSTPPVPALIPAGVKVMRFHEGPVHGDRLRVDRPRMAVLYLHGGGYIAGSPRNYHNLAARLASGLQADVWLPAYRLAPEHPYPAALEDAVHCYERMLSYGYAPQQITIMGDSAGGGLTLATLLALRDQGYPRPRCAIAMSPYADLTCSARSHHENDAHDPMLSAAMLRGAPHAYAQNGEDKRHPYISPAFGDYHDICPLLLTVCEHECLRDDAYAVAAKARAANVQVEFIARPHLMHVWPIFVPLMPEARQDVKRFINFIRQQG